VLREIEREDEIWAEQRKKPRRKQEAAPALEPTNPNNATEKDATSTTKKSNAPAGFY
jgi:hypothetical protein